jgi:hypothetical protein
MGNGGVLLNSGEAVEVPAPGGASASSVRIVHVQAIQLLNNSLLLYYLEISSDYDRLCFLYLVLDICFPISVKGIWPSIECKNVMSQFSKRYVLFGGVVV